MSGLATHVLDLTDDDPTGYSRPPIASGGLVRRDGGPRLSRFK